MSDVNMTNKNKVLNTPFDEWCGMVSDFLSKASLDEIVSYMDLYASWKKKDIRLDYFEISVAEVVALQSVYESEYSVKRKSFSLFVEKSMAFINKYYGDSIALGRKEKLPLIGKVALALKNGLDSEEKHPEVAPGRIAHVVTLDPNWGATIKTYLDAFSRELDRREREKKQEMKKLRLQVMDEVRRLSDDKKYNDALSVAAQLKTMVPNDLEVMGLSLKVRLQMATSRNA